MLDLDPCKSNPCQNGVCRNNDGVYSCDCEPGYEGNNCQVGKSCMAPDIFIIDQSWFIRLIHAQLVLYQRNLSVTATLARMAADALMD